MSHAILLATIANLEREAIRLRAENERLRKGLGFYSDGFAYLTPEGWKLIWRDGGRTARTALGTDEIQEEGS